MTTVEQVLAGFVVLIIWRELDTLDRKTRMMSDQIVKLKIILDQVKNAIGDNAFEAMLDKPIQPRIERFVSPEDLYRSHGGQVK